MKQSLTRFICVLTLLAFSTTQLSGCVAGNFGLTRKLARWNLSFSIFPRIIVYIALIIIPVYAITLLFDFIINNTIEFWTNSPVVSAQNHTFEQDGYRVEVEHSRNSLSK
jgi:hypothetical protein